MRDDYLRCDDRKVIGFDCSGLSLYAVYKRCGLKLPHKASEQYDYVKDQRKLFSYSQAKPKVFSLLKKIGTFIMLLFILVLAKCGNFQDMIVIVKGYLPKNLPLRVM